MNEAAPLLLVDDDDAVRLTFRRVLERAGFEVLEAARGEAGIELCRERDPGLVLLDLRMPGMDGLEVLSRLVAEHPETPVIVISGHGTMTDAVEALRRGAWDFVSKPLPSNELLEHAVRRGMERSALLRQNRAYRASLEAANQRLSSALAELHADEHAARQLQFELLPSAELRVATLVFERRLFPSRLLSGDFVDYFALNERYAGFYLADVAGHGVASAFVTTILTTLVGKYRQALFLRGDETILEPARLLRELDADLKELAIPKHVTSFYGVIELASGHFVYGNAGAFPYPHLSNGAELECPGRPLNLPGNAGFGLGEADLEPGGRLLLASDGVLELAPRASHRARRAELGALLARAGSLADITTALELREDTPRKDDVALLFVRREEKR
ncbi:MAG TPA: response regulator [Polyangiaceae bacterium]|nr:response regulator [Polyangiaceae bacterium]